MDFLSVRMHFSAVASILLWGATPGICNLSNDSQSSSPDLRELGPNLQQLGDIQKQIFDVKSQTKEDREIENEALLEIFPLMAADMSSPAPDQLPYLFEGDIILTDEQLEEIINNAYATLASQLNRTSFKRKKRSVTRNLNLRWATFPIPFYINTDTGVDEQAVLKGIDRWEADTCLTFTRELTYPTQKNALEFIRGAGCYSFIGRSGNRPQQVSIGTGCTSLGTVTHEIGHALGLYHEQSRYDRDNYIDILVDNIQSSYLGQFSRQGIKMMVDFGVGYDYGSVMHYDQSSFNKRGKRTIETTDDNYQQTIGQRGRPSFADVKRINFAYCNASCPRQMNCLNGGYTDPKKCEQCRCPDGLGGLFCNGVETSTDDCGQHSFSSTEDFQTVTMTGKKTCYYLVKAPAGQTVFFQLGNMTFKNHNPCSSEYLEVKYRENLVQSGARYCKNYPTNSLSESNTLIFIYKGSNTSAINLQFKTGLSLSARSELANGTNYDY